MLAEFPPVSILQMLGLMGAGLYMTNYALLTLRFISADMSIYFVMNLAAASLVLISLADAFSAASFAIQVFWISVSLIGILRTFPNAQRKEASPDRLRPLA